MLDTVPATHLPALTPTDGPRALWLCQEWSMRTRAYDDIARVQFYSGHGIVPRPVGAGDFAYGEKDRHGLLTGRWVVNSTFAHGVSSVGLERAIRALQRCLWVSGSDFKAAEPQPCAECLEARHS